MKSKVKPYRIAKAIKVTEFVDSRMTIQEFYVDQMTVKNVIPGDKSLRVHARITSEIDFTNAELLPVIELTTGLVEAVSVGVWRVRGSAKTWPLVRTPTAWFKATPQ